MKLTAWPIAFNAQESADHRTHATLVPQFTMRAELISLSSWISAEAFDKGHAACNPNDDTLLHFECFQKQACGENP